MGRREEKTGKRKVRFRGKQQLRERGGGFPFSRFAIAPSPAFLILSLRKLGCNNDLNEFPLRC